MTSAALHPANLGDGLEVGAVRAAVRHGNLVDVGQRGLGHRLGDARVLVDRGFEPREIGPQRIEVDADGTVPGTTSRTPGSARARRRSLRSIAR